MFLIGGAVMAGEEEEDSVREDIRKNPISFGQCPKGGGGGVNRNPKVLR